MPASRLDSHLGDAQTHDPVVICVAPNGALRTNSDHTRLPMSARELAAEARLCRDAGATAIHLHVRDADGRHSLDAVLYREAIDAVRDATAGQMVIQITTEACGVFSPEQQMRAVREVRPDAASVAVRELVPDESSCPAAQQFFSWACERGIGLQYVVYDGADLRRAVELGNRGVIPNELPHILLVLGRYSKGEAFAPTDLDPLLEGVPASWPWSLCAFGSTEAQCMAAAIGRGGHCRVGFKNNLLLPGGEAASSNADLVAITRKNIEQSSRAIGSLRDARALYIG